MIKPVMISYHNDLDVIPFASVKAVLGDVVDGKPKIEIVIDNHNKIGILIGDEANAFIKQYNSYLRFIELGIMDQKTPVPKQ